jgi:hypothetical protein
MASAKGHNVVAKFSNKFSFSGHKAPVTCLSISPSHTKLASSSEDQTIRIWDLNTKKCSKICLPNKEFFAKPTNNPQNSESDDSPEIASLAFVSDHILLAGIESRLVVFNLNTEDVLIRQTTAHLELEAGEINSIDLASNESKEGHFVILCACDNGIVVVHIDIADPTNLMKHRKLETIHSAFVTTAAWTHPRKASSNSFLSGGFDCKLNLVSFTEDGAETVKTVDLNTQEAQTTGNVKQMFNPPYVHSVALVSNGWAMASTGSGNLEFLHLERFIRADPLEIHASSANVVCFSRVEGIGEVILSTGSDGILSVRSFLSPVDSDVEKYANIRTRQRELETRVATSKKPMTKPQQKLWTNFKTQLSQLNGVPSAPLLLKTKLANNANWMVASQSITPSGNVFIADTSNDIICLTVSI